MISIEGMDIPTAISYLKGQMKTLHDEIKRLIPQEASIPMIMTLLVDAQSSLQALLTSQEKKAREMLKDLGPLTPENIAVLQHLSASSTDQPLPPTTVSSTDLAVSSTDLALALALSIPDKSLRPTTSSSTDLAMAQPLSPTTTTTSSTDLPLPPTTKTYKKWTPSLNKDLEASMKKVVERLGDKHTSTDVAEQFQKDHPGMPARKVIDRIKRGKKFKIPKSETSCITLPGSKKSLTKVAGLLYTNSGDAILALGSNGALRIWKWTEKANGTSAPQPESELLLKHDVTEEEAVSCLAEEAVSCLAEEAVSCLALTKTDSLVLSAIGSSFMSFNLRSSELQDIVPQGLTFLAFDPQDDNIVAVGMNDSRIGICEIESGEGISTLEGHEKRITGLAFSTELKILVSSGADGQLVFWDTRTWEKKTSLAVPIPAEGSKKKQKPAGGVNTRVQFHSDQVQLLVSHEKQLFVYNAATRECSHQWLPARMYLDIASASYSGNNSQLVYALFANGSIVLLDESLEFKTRIFPSTYMPPATPNSEPLIAQVIAANPKDTGVVAVGFSDGSVMVIKQSAIS